LSPPDSTRAHELCLVTGASGFIGGRLAERLRSHGYPVRALARTSSDTDALRVRGIEIATADLAHADAGALREAMDGVRHVFHCAALVSDWASVEQILATNVAGTRAVLAAARSAGIGRFVHLSTTDVYGYPGGTGIEESCRSTRFRNWYSESKRRAEAEVAQAAGSLEIVVLRPATVYGPGSKEVVGEIARAIRARHMLLLDRGRAVAGLCFIENLIDACLLALQHANAPGRTFNVTDGIDVTWRRFTDDLASGLARPPARLSLPFGPARLIGQLLEESYRLARRAGAPPIPALLSRQAVDVLGCDQDFSNRLARELLGWSPRVSYEEGLAATLTWLTEDYLP
jgi:nucleoside-diphosphate-sugar epimerase